MSDQILLVKILEMQQKGNRRGSQKDEDAFYRAHGCSFAHDVIQFWRRLVQTSATKPKN